MKFRRLKIFGAILVLLFVCANGIAYFHAYRLTHFVEVGTRTQSPDKLSAWGRITVLLTGVKIPRPANRGTPVGVHYRTVRIEERLEAWDIDGDGEVVVMFPGHATAKSSLLEEAKAFRELGCRCVLVDFRGCGGSDGNVCTLGWNEADDVVAAVNWVRHEYPGRHIILHGESMGAAALLRAIAVKGLKPDAIMLECPFDRLITTVGHRYQMMHLPAFPLANLLLFWGGVQHGFNSFNHNPLDYAANVTVPALVIGGQNDPWVMPEEVWAVGAAIQGPTIVKIFKDGGHGAYIWSDPEAYRHALETWLTGVRLGWSKVSG